MRKRINTKAICSSDNYRASKRVHKAMLERNHQAFTAMVVSGEIVIEEKEIATPKAEINPKSIRVKIFGRWTTFSWEYYVSHPLGFEGMKIEKIWQ